MQLDDLGYVGRGKSKHRPRNDPTLYGGAYPFVQTGDVKEADLWLTHHTQTYNETGLAQSKLWPVGTLCITIAANIAETAILNFPACFPDSIVGFVPYPGKADARFVKYYIDTIKLRIQNASKGTTQDNLSVDKLLSFDFQVPNYRTQERIASVLSAYDSLIENDTRRIKILEEMAQILYREWFVDFRFPGHESWPFIASDLGEIPKNWRVSRLVDVTTKIGSGATPRGGNKSYQKEGITLIRSLNIYDYRFEMANLAFINDEQAEQLNNVTIEPNDVLLNITGASVGRCSMVPSCLLPARVNQHVAIVRAKSEIIDPFFLLDSINSDHNKQRLLGIAQGGATREALTRDSIAGFPILLPPLDLIRRYGQIAGLFHTQRENLHLRIETLRTTRDLLLPKLISGEISVEDSEAEAVAQGV
jgi:type I restriction enzyme S subunit